MSKEALLIIDMLNDFVLEGAPLEVPDNRKAIPAIRREIDAAHKEGRPVIYVCDAHAPDDPEFSKFGWPPHAVQGTEGAEVVDELRPESGDEVVEKTTYSAFYGTRLEELLKSRGVDAVRLTGCVTHICIMIAALEAGLRGYEVSAVVDGIAGLAQDDHEAGLRIMKNVAGAKLIGEGQY